MTSLSEKLPPTRRRLGEVVAPDSANRSRGDHHHFGDNRQAPITVLVMETRTEMVPAAAMMKGKYPNGLAEALKLNPKIKGKDLAEAVGTSPQQISRLLQGERELTAQWAERLGPILKTPPEVLVFPSLRRFRAPLISWVSAGRLTHQEGVRRADIRKYVMLADLPKGDWIVLEVEGDSMDRIAPDGSMICVNLSDQKPVNDKFFVFSTPEGEVTFKRYRHGNPPRLQPFSFNPDHETIIPRGDLLVLGRVGRVITDLR